MYSNKFIIAIVVYYFRCIKSNSVNKNECINYRSAIIQNSLNVGTLNRRFL